MILLRYVKQSAYPDNLIMEILEDGNIAVTDDMRKGLQYTLETIKDAEVNILLLRYSSCMTYEKIGKQCGIPTSRVRSNMAKALQKLRHPARVIFISKGLACVTKLRGRPPL